MKILYFSKIISAALVAASFSVAAQAAPTRIGFSSEISASGVFNLEWQYDLNLADGSIKHLEYVRPVGFSMRFSISDQEILNPVGDCPIVYVGGSSCTIQTDYVGFADALQGGSIAIDRATRQATGRVRLIDWRDVGNDGFIYPATLLYNPELDTLTPIENPAQSFPVVDLDLATSSVSVLPSIYGSVLLLEGTLPFSTGDSFRSRVPWKTVLVNGKATVSIPEPAGLSLLGLGVIAVALRRRKRR